MTSELSSVTSIFLYEVTVFEQLVLSGIHEDCEVIITSPIPVMLPSLERNCNCSGLWGKNKTKPDASKAEETKKGSSVSLLLIIGAGICLVWVECASIPCLRCLL